MKKPLKGSKQRQDIIRLELLKNHRTYSEKNSTEGEQEDLGRSDWSIITKEMMVSWPRYNSSEDGEK